MHAGLVSREAIGTFRLLTVLTCLSSSRGFRAFANETGHPYYISLYIKQIIGHGSSRCRWTCSVGPKTEPKADDEFEIDIDNENVDCRPPDIVIGKRIELNKRDIHTHFKILVGLGFLVIRSGKQHDFVQQPSRHLGPSNIGTVGEDSRRPVLQAVERGQLIRWNRPTIHQD